MPSENLVKLHDELVAARAVLDPQIEGLKDFERLNIQEATKAKVTETKLQFEARRDLISNAVNALDSLNGHGFPDTPNISVAQEIFANLKENVDTIGAAFSKFKPEQAVDLGVDVGSPVPKP